MSTLKRVQTCIRHSMNNCLLSSSCPLARLGHWTCSVSLTFQWGSHTMAWDVPQVYVYTTFSVCGSHPFWPGTLLSLPYVSALSLLVDLHLVQSVWLYFISYQLIYIPFICRCPCFSPAQRQSIGTIIARIIMLYSWNRIPDVRWSLLTTTLRRRVSACPNTYMGLPVTVCMEHELT